jgi:hypothetical protein
MYLIKNQFKGKGIFRRSAISKKKPMMIWKINRQMQLHSSIANLMKKDTVRKQTTIIWGEVLCNQEAN